MKHTITKHLLLLLLAAMLTLSLRTLLAQTGVSAEAIGQANLRAAPGTDAALVGQITAGTVYQVVGRSEFFPWLLLADGTGQPIGWVFADLVKVSGNIAQVPFSVITVGAAPTPTFALTAAFTADAPALSATPTLNAPVTGLVTGDINVRYGPGVDYPRIGFARAGEVFEITGWHSQFPWLQIRYPGAPNGWGWVARDLLEITGDVFSLPSITQVRFDLPTLTPTPPAVQASSLFAAAPTAVSPEFQALGDRLWNMVLEAGFEPETSRLGALFLLDLQTGEAISFGSKIAFSGMSLTKIAILAEMYRKLDTPPRPREAMTIASAMVCSENTSTNEMLNFIGQGDPYRGAQEVTSLMQRLGLGDTFLVAPYIIDPNKVPQPPYPIFAPVTAADQSKANPDAWNQMTVDSLGRLLADIYQCGYGETGPLIEQFPGAVEPRECRQMLHVMSSNKIGALIESGVPSGTRVAHKHGWINDTHGDAGVVFTPGGNYALVVVLHSPVWLNFEESFPLIAEIGRTIYNYYNPGAPLETINDEPVPETCDLRNSPLVDELMSGTFDG